MKINSEDLIWNELGGVQILGTGDYTIAGIDSTGIMKWGINSMGDFICEDSFEVEAIADENKERCEYCGSWKDMYKSCEKCGAP